VSGGIAKIVSDRPVPVAPTGLASQTNGRTVTLTWNGVNGATSYRIEAGSRSGAADLAVIDTGSAQPSFTATNVGDGVYYVRVRALIGAAASVESNEVVVAVGAPPCTSPPPAPAGLGYAVSGRFVSLAWIASGTITSTILEAGYSPGLTNAAMIVLDPSARSYATPAPPGTYYVRVRTVNACGESGASNEIVVPVP
jgi:hypothetical protein